MMQMHVNNGDTTSTETTKTMYMYRTWHRFAVYILSALKILFIKASPNRKTLNSIRM